MDREIRIDVWHSPNYRHSELFYGGLVIKGREWGVPRGQRRRGDKFSFEWRDTVGETLATVQYGFRGDEHDDPAWREPEPPDALLQQMRDEYQQLVEHGLLDAPDVSGFKSCDKEWRKLRSRSK